jgi:hypothetical protein
VRTLRLLLIIGALFVGGVSLAVAASSEDPQPAVTETTATTEPAAEETSRVAVCHRTGSKKKPYRIISVSSEALAAHLGHGDVLAGGETCPAALVKTRKAKKPKKIVVAESRNAPGERGAPAPGGSTTTGEPAPDQGRNGDRGPGDGKGTDDDEDTGKSRDENKGRGNGSGGGKN